MLELFLGENQLTIITQFRQKVYQYNYLGGVYCLQSEFCIHIRFVDVVNGQYHMYCSPE